MEVREQTLTCPRATCGASRIGHGLCVTKEGVVSSVSAQPGARTASRLCSKGTMGSSESIGTAPLGPSTAGVENAPLRVAKGRVSAGFPFAT